MSNEDFSEQLAAIRADLFKNKVSQRRLAKTLGMDKTYLSNLLNGNQRSVSFNKFTQIKEAAAALIKERTKEK